MKRRSLNRCRRGMVIGDVLIVVATIVLIGMILLPALVRPHSCGGGSARIRCVNNLKQVGLSFRIYANDHDDLYPMAVPVTEGGARDASEGGDAFRVFQVMSNELSIPKTVLCPTDSRTAATNFAGFDNANVSYLVGWNAVDTKPDMILSGDRNIEIEGELLSGMASLRTNALPEWSAAMHRDGGNVGLADGSVMQVSTVGLRTQLRSSGDEENRLLFPQ